VSSSKISRAPVWVLTGGMALAIGLVLLGARLAAQPAPVPDLSRPGTAAEPRQVSVIMRDYAFNPTPLYLVGGETVEFYIINGGLVAHEFVLGDSEVQRAWAVASGATPAAPFATPPPASVPPAIGGVRVLLASGADARVRYEVPPAGAQLQLMCHLPGHLARGMVGEVILTSR